MDRFPAGNPIENKQSKIKREMIWASALFLLMFLTVVGLGSAIIINDLSNKEVFRVLKGYSSELEDILGKVPTTETYKGFQQQKIITTRLDAFLTEKKIFSSVDLYDDKGNLVYHKDTLQRADLIGGGPSGGLLPGQQRIETRNKIPISVPVPIEPGKMGKVILSVSQDVLARQAREFRADLVAKLVGMISVILFMVGLAYLYVLRILRLSRRYEAEAQEQKRLSYIGLLSSGIAHEIKNPLNSIQMNLQLMEEEAINGTSPGELSNWVEPIQKEIRRLERLVNEFLMFARPLKPEPAVTDVQSLFDSICVLVAEEARRKGVNVIAETDPDLPPIILDESLVRTALLNLVFNGIQAYEGGGAIRLNGYPQGDKLVLEVSDEGPGIHADKREQVFQIFYTTKAGGTGLGLPISRRILEGLGGSLTLVDQDGPGTRFQAVLPMEKA